MTWCMLVHMSKLYYQSFVNDVLYDYLEAK